MPTSVFVIAPDKPSGDAFNTELVRRGVKTEIYYADIEPRVIGDQINTNPKVERDLASAIAAGHRQGFRRMVIACNTLQLWVDRARELLSPGVSRRVRVVTTFDALRQQFPHPETRPLWLGTTVTVRFVKDFPTLLSLGKPEVQDVVQRIIWRTKAVTGADTKAAPANIEDMANAGKLREDVKWIVRELKRLGIKEVVLGCTELPIAFGYINEEEKTSLTLVDPAVAVAEKLRLG